VHVKALHGQQHHIWATFTTNNEFSGLLTHLTPYVLMGVCHPLQPAGLSCMDNVVKECQEEASIPAALAKTARPVGVVSYAGDSRCACDAGMDGHVRGQLL